MKNKKEKKDKKKRLSLLILLMFLSIILLSTSTYAWFTANRTVKIEDINVHVETSGGLQISTNAVDWKTAISNVDITTGAYSGNINQFPGTLRPTSSILAVNANGQMEMYTSTTGTRSDGEFTFSTTKATDTQGTTGDYIAFDIFLKNEASGNDDDGSIYLTTSSDVVTKEGTNDIGLKQSARVAFVVEGTSTNLTATPTTYTSLNRGAGALGAGIILWEPNYDVHTASGAASATYYFDQTSEPSLTGAAAITYLGVKEAFTDIPLRYSLQQTADKAHFAPVSTATLTDSTFKYIITPAANVTNGEYKLFLKAIGITKIRVYMWIEGQDVDCENNVSGSDITYKVVLSKNSEDDAVTP